MPNINDDHVDELLERVKAEPNTTCRACKKLITNWKQGAGVAPWEQDMTVWKFCPHCGESETEDRGCLYLFLLIGTFAFILWLYEWYETGVMPGLFKQ